MGFECLEGSRINHLVLNLCGAWAPVNKHQLVNIPGRDISGLVLEVKDSVCGHVLLEVGNEVSPVFCLSSLLGKNDLMDVNKGGESEYAVLCFAKTVENVSISTLLLKIEESFLGVFSWLNGYHCAMLFYN